MPRSADRQKRNDPQTAVASIRRPPQALPDVGPNPKTTDPASTLAKSESCGAKPGTGLSDLVPGVRSDAKLSFKQRAPKGRGEGGGPQLWGLVRVLPSFDPLRTLLKLALHRANSEWFSSCERETPHLSDGLAGEKCPLGTRSWIP